MSTIYSDDMRISNLLYDACSASYILQLESGESGGTYSSPNNGLHLLVKNIFPGRELINLLKAL